MELISHTYVILFIEQNGSINTQIMSSFTLQYTPYPKGCSHIKYFPKGLSIVLVTRAYEKSIDIKNEIFQRAVFEKCAIIFGAHKQNFYF